MSSDPIEVLRDLEAKLNRLEDKYREAIKGRDAADPLTNHRLGLAEGFGVAAMCVRDALASLSAPKPPPMNDNAVAVNESAPVNDKPESAEAAGEVFGPKAVSTMVALERPLPPGTKLYTAPPRPEASEPVVDRASAVKLAQAAAYASHHQHSYLPHTAEEARNWQPHEWVVDAILAATLDTAPQQASAPVGVEGWAVTKLRPHEARCEACGRAVWDGKDRANCVGFLAPCGKRVARLEDCGTVDCLEALAQQPAAEYADAEALIAHLDTLCDHSDEKWDVAQAAIAGIRAAQQPAAVDGAMKADAEELALVAQEIGLDDPLSARILSVRTRVLAAAFRNAQQPAAVDGEMVERALSARAGSWSVRQLFADEDEAPDIMRIALTAALAAQPGGSDDDR